MQFKINLKLILIALATAVTGFSQSAMQSNSIPSSGSVGIGTRRPARPLHIASENGGEMLFEGLNGKPNFRRWSFYVGGGSEQEKSLYLRILDDTGTRSSLDSMIWKHDGFLGLVNMDPQWQLSLTGKGQRGAALAFSSHGGGSILLNATDVGPGSGGAVLFGVNSGALGANGFFAAIKALHSDGSGFEAGDLAISLRASTSDRLLTERLRITKGGDVGVGTEQPISRLHVSGNLSVTEGGQIHLSAGYDNGLWGTKILARDNNAGHDLVFGIRKTPTGSFDDAMVIGSNGNVGIGVSQPNQKLSVNGVVVAAEFVAEQPAPPAIAADLAPEESIEEIANYLRKHRELSGLPHRTTVSVAANQRALQVTIEQLALHIVALNQRIVEIETKLNSRELLKK